MADEFHEKSEMCVENMLYTVFEIPVSATVISIIRISVCFLFIFYFNCSKKVDAVRKKASSCTKHIVTIRPLCCLDLQKS